MGKPIVFAKCDGRPGNEALMLIYRPNRSTTKGERHVTIRATSFDRNSLLEIQRFIKVAQRTVEAKSQHEIRVLQVEGPEGPADLW